MENNNQSQQTSHPTPLPPHDGQEVGLSMVRLWRMLERTEEELHASYKRLRPRTLLKLWFPSRATNDFISEVCRLSDLGGYEELPPVRLYPRKHRELLRAIIAATQGIGMRQVDTQALDRAFSQAFPHSTRLNINKRKRE